MPTLTEQETIEKAVIGKRVVAVAWEPGLDRDQFAVSLITLEGGVTLDFKGGYYDAVYVKVRENDHADA